MSHDSYITVNERPELKSISTIGQTQSPLTCDPCRYCSSKKICDAVCLSQKLPIADRSRLFRSHKVKKGKHLFFTGDDLDVLYVVKTGLFKTYVISEDGDEQVIDFHMPGQLIGADAIAHGRHNLSAMTLETSTVCVLNLKQIESMSDQPINQWLFDQLHNEVMKERHLLQITRRKYNSVARVANFLLEMSERNKQRNYSEREFKLNMPQRDIAHYLDMVLETVSRVLTRLQDAGIITINRPYVTINDFDKLKALIQDPIVPEALSA